MKIIILAVWFLLLHLNGAYSQDFLETKYSINDINLQREKFRSQKIKAVIIYGSRYNIDQDGKITECVSEEDNQYYLKYSYKKNNLISKTSSGGNETFKYDANGNVIYSFNGANSSTYFYDSNNKLLKVITEMESEEGEGTCGPDNVKYNGYHIIEEVYPCCMGFNERTTYEYSENNTLLKKTHYENNCDVENEIVRNSEDYFYSRNSIFPSKIITTWWNDGSQKYEVNDTIISYEYY